MPSRCRRLASRRWFLRSRFARYSAPPPSRAARTDGSLRLCRRRGDGRRFGDRGLRLRRRCLARGRARLRAGGARRGRAGRCRIGPVVGEHAFQRSVAQVGLALGREADGLELPLVTGEHDGVPSRERLPEALAELPVDGLGVRGFEPFAVRGIGGEQAVLRGRDDRVQLGVVDRDEAVQPGALHEVARDLHGALVPVRAADGHAGARRRKPFDADAASLARLEQQRVPEVGVVLAPAQEAERRRGPRLGLRLGAQQAGSDVGRHEGRLDRAACPTRTAGRGGWRRRRPRPARPRTAGVRRPGSP